MKLIPLSNEKNVDQLLDTIYVELTSQSRDAARSALIQLNPDLAQIDQMQVGTLIRIPTISGLLINTSSSIVDPIAESIDNIIGKLQDYGATINERFSEKRQQQQVMLATLDNDVVDKVIQANEETVKISEQLKPHLSSVISTSAANEKKVSVAISALLVSLEALKE